MSDKFWAVWRKTSGDSPSPRYVSLEAAKDEAARLATQTGENYYILECIGVIAVPEVPYQYLEID